MTGEANAPQGVQDCSWPDKTALVTGANRGIGAATARLLVQAGCHVYVASRNIEAAHQCISNTSLYASRMTPVALDVSSSSQTAKVVSLINDRHGKLDILINNAGILRGQNDRALDADHEEVRESLDINMLAPWQIIQKCAPLLMRGDRGCIINISSGVGTFGYARSGRAPYRISKGALNLLTVMMAQELAPAGIRVNAVCPGWVATRMGGKGGRPVEEAARGIIYSIAKSLEGVTGCFMRDGVAIPW